MPIPINRLIKEHKLDPKSLEKAFRQDTIKERPKVEQLVKNISELIHNGIDRNRKDYRLFKAMDWAYDAPFYQVSYTQLRGLLTSNPDKKKVMETVNQWGLTHLLPDKINPDGTVCCENGKPVKMLNLPVFFHIFVPLVMAYITIRWAKLFNDRNLIPLYKYEPVQFTRENRFRCEVITQVVQRQSKWFDYPADLKQSILQTLLYGFCINFPREAWYCERQEDDKGDPKIQREGLRWNMPHPSRTYYDLYHRLSTLNSNSGCEYAGYWELCRYKEINDNPLYWNKDRITMGATGWFDTAGSSDFLQQVFPCQMEWPKDAGALGGPGGVGALDRQNEAARTYSNGDYNAATLLTQHFQRIIPKDHGLGSYEYPVWFRFVFASDSTVVWAEPLSFGVLPTYTYDADFNRARFRSLALEITPFQDHISNVLTQWILAVKDNLGNPVFYDEDKIPSNYVQELRNLGHKIYQGRLYIPFSSTANYRFKTDQREAFYSPQLTHHPTGELQNLLNGVITMLDRVMQLSPQEIGQAAPHEQTAEETRVIASNTSTRVTFTGTGIDSGDDAKKTAMYEAMMAHADDNVIVGITSNLATDKDDFNKMLKTTGFELTDKDAGYDPDKPEMMYAVKGNKSGLSIESFSSTRDNANRINLPAVADAMSKIFLAIAGNPVLIQAIGPPQLVELLNQIIVSSGVPQEFRLKGKPLDQLPQEEQAQQTAEMFKQFATKVQELVAGKQQETLQLAAQQTTQIVGQAAQAIQQQGAQQAAQAAAGVQQAMQQAGPAIQAAQEAAQVAAQKISQHDQVIAQQQQEIDSLKQLAQQLTELVQGAAPVGAT